MGSRTTWKNAVVGASIASLLGAQPALADDYIYKGDCQRAELIKKERTVDKLLPHSAYRGVLRSQGGGDPCGRETLMSVDLNQQSRSASAVVFSFRRVDIMRNRVSGTCSDPDGNFAQYVGTVTFTLQSTSNGGVCELYLWSNWKDTGTGPAKMTFANRMVWLNNFSFAITQTPASQGLWLTPMAFVGTPAQ